MVPSNEELELERVIRSAGEKLLEYWPGRRSTGDKPRLDVQTKGDGSPVSEADLASNEILLAGLRRIYPDDEIVSEEIERTASTGKMLPYWIIDPLDGTRAFLEGRDDFSVLAGRIVRGKAQSGRMYFPAHGIFARADDGAGAWIGDTRVEVSPVAKLRNQSLYFRNVKLPAGPHLFTDTLDSGMAFLNLACGKLDGIILRMTTHREWDIAAPAVVVTEAGGRMSDENGEPIVFDDRGIYFRYLVASNGKIHEDLLELVRALPHD